MKTINRFFYKCEDCFAVVTVEFKHMKAVCGFCSGRMELMGQVKQDTLIKTEERCACDARCTGASGPVCNCHCGGENHGTGKLITVTTHVNGIPVFNPREGDKEEHLRIAMEIKSLVAEYKKLFTTKYPTIIEKKKAGRWLDGNEYLAYKDFITVLERVKNYRTYASRLKLLRTKISTLKSH